MAGSAGIMPAGFGILPNPVIQRAAKCSRKVSPATSGKPLREFSNEIPGDNSWQSGQESYVRGWGVNS
jgi:hypothetical protein